MAIQNTFSCSPTKRLSFHDFRLIIATPEWNKNAPKELKRITWLVANHILGYKAHSKHTDLGSFSLSTSTTTSIQSQKQSIFPASHYIDLTAWETQSLCHDVPQHFFLNDFSRTLKIFGGYGQQCLEDPDLNCGICSLGILEELNLGIFLADFRIKHWTAGFFFFSHIKMGNDLMK